MANILEDPLVDLPSGHIVKLSEVHLEKTLVVPQIQINFTSS